MFEKEAVQPRGASSEDVKEALKKPIPIVQYKKLCKKERTFDWVSQKSKRSLLEE